MGSAALGIPLLPLYLFSYLGELAGVDMFPPFFSDTAELAVSVST